MNEKKEVDVLSKKRPTVNELKTEVIRLRKSNEKSDAANNQLEANNKALSNSVESLKIKLDKANKAYEELKAKRQYNTVGFVIASLIALGAVAVIILRLV